MKLDAPSLPTTAEPAADACPRCGKTLIDPTGLGWCAGCGYCKSLAEDESSRLLEQRKAPSLGGVVEAGGAVVGLPIWFWGCFPFLAAGVVFGAVMNGRLPQGNCLERATWTTAQIASGALLIFFAQVVALIAIAPQEPTLSFKDAVAPFRLWGLVFKRLPRCKECLWAALLGLGLIVGAAGFIGGLQHWFSYLPKSSAQRSNDRPRSGNPGESGGTAVVLPMD